MKARLGQWTDNRIIRRRTGGGGQGNGGFTLVELIVVLVVLGILATLGVMSLIGWQDYADFKQSNEFAKSIFQAAQIQITQYGERGQLTELIDAVTDGGKAPKAEYLLSEQGGLISSDGGSLNVADGSGSTIWENGYTGNIYYLMAEKGDYDTYVKELKGLSASEISTRTVKERRIKVLFDMLDPYISDKSMFDAAICVEFDPDPKVALVYSVFYNHKAERFTYEDTGSSGQSDGTAPIRDRSSRTRRDAKTGYYGAETMARGTDTYISRPVISNVRLNNEETLNLSWSTKGDNGKELTRLVYSINLFGQAAGAAGDGELLMTIMLGKTDAEQLPVTDGRIQASVSKLKADGTTWTAAEEYTFPITVNTAESTIALVLDGLDLNADEKTVPEELKETASIRRLSLDTDYIYAVITGSRSGVYDITTKKRSNSEHQYFGGMTVNADSSVTYTVENARHLNNIRYREAEYAEGGGLNAPGFIYQISRDISWEYALNKGSVYQEAVQKLPVGDDITPYYFRPILTLGRNSVLESDNGEQGRSLTKFRFDAAHTAESGDGARNLGLVAENRGTIRNLSMKGVYVDGVAEKEDGGTAYAAAAGAFCGVNKGTLSNLSVEESFDHTVSRVSGLAFAGGIAGRSGALESGDDRQAYEKLTNRADVSGQRYVGGIVGSLESKGGKITVKECRNYGKVRGEIVESGKEAYFFGGITGYAGFSGDTGTAGTASLISLEDCKSSPHYTDDEIRELIGNIQNPDSTELVENYVGGIAGYNDIAQIINCSTEQEQAGRRGYVIGKDYVGGIVGYNSSLVSLEGGTSNRNQVHVIGHSFVGGIAGCNAVGVLEGDGDSGFRLVLAGKDTAGEAKIRGWVNEGVITSTGDFAGGITGFNGETGLLEDSYSNVEYDESAETLAQVSSQARFAGGVAGYNKGRIAGRDMSRITTVSVVSGKDYVGGVVGCNDVGGVIKNYELEGGYVGGKRFVGGFIGLNMEAGIFDNQIKSNPNKVSGDYFVGGVIGGNLVPIAETRNELPVSFETDNFLGDLLAENGAFAGGFIGYNYLLQMQAAQEDEEATKAQAGTAGIMKISHILAAADRLCMEGALADGRIPVLDASSEEVCDAATGQALDGAQLEKLLADVLSSYANHNVRMVIAGVGNNTSHQTLGSVRGKAYVGGVVGYNQPTTHLEIKNIENITPVEATGYMMRTEEGMDTEHRFSYAGGMIGKVGERVTLNHCSNRDVGEVRGKGTYTGGLAEINYGTVKDCTAGNIGDGTASYVGGIVGVNADKYRTAGGTAGTAATAGNGRGLLADCSVGGQVSGVSYVGGLVAENFGIIQYTDRSIAGEMGTDPTVDAGGRYAGGLVGYAHEGGEILIDGDITLGINVVGSAQYVGGIAGVNAGIIKTAESTQRYFIRNDEENTITGQNYVGGFIGMQLEPQDGETEAKNSTVTLRRFENHAGVQASYGYAGGIVALVQKLPHSGEAEKHAVTDKVILESCSNYGKVEVLSEEDDDEEEVLPDEGVTDPDEGLIPDTDDEGISAAGGITAVSHGIIKLCGNYGEVSANSGYMGGITAFNYHEIDRSETAAGDTAVDEGSVPDVLVLSGDLRVGGIAAVNAAVERTDKKEKQKGSIKRCAVRNVILRNQSSSESGLMGGIAALNEGEIEDCFVGVGLDPKKLADDEKSDSDNSAYSGLREEAAGYVVAGMAASTFQKDGGLQGNSILLISYAADVNMGGIAGQNEETIKGTEHSYKGSGYYSVAAADLRFDSDSMNYFGNIGGIAGVNGGTIEKYEFSGYVRGSAGDPSSTPEYSPAYDLERNKSRIYGYGGIAGSNGSDLTPSNDAVIERCYLGMAKIEGTGDGSNRANVGGVAGFNGAGAVIKDITFSQIDGADGLGVKTYFAETLDASYVKGNSTKWDPATTVSKRGSVWVNVTNYGHLGGVAGYNRGAISDINWTVDYVKNREIEGSSSEGYFPGGKYTGKHISEVDNTGVLVTSSAGLVGGITGYNHRTGAVSRAVTGNSWLVSAISQQLGNGIGGIIGYNISESDIVSCDNHATVFKKADDAVGGITGCQETGTSSSWRYYDCKNYGTLYANNRGGGIIGVWKYKGGTVEKCQNYGEVCSLNTCGGGIVSLVESVSSGETINLTRCENFGEVYSNNYLVRLAGILSHVDDSQAKIDIKISECVNTGNIIGNYVAKDPSVGMLVGRGGIFATTENDSNVEIRYCRNYSYIREDSRFYGITKGTPNTTLEYCFGAANGNTAINAGKVGTWGIQYPLSEAGNVKNSYYFVDYQNIYGGMGTRIRVENNKGVVYGYNYPEIVVPDMGNYGTGDIVFQADRERTRRYSHESYQLCKGTSSRTGLDDYLQKVGDSEWTLFAPVINTPSLAANGEYTVSWNPVSGARYYNVVCEYLNADGGIIGAKSSTVYTNSALISTTFESGGYFASGVQVKVQACSEKAVSGFSDTRKIVFGIRLPYPQVSWELNHLSYDGNLYRVVLNNRKDYEKFVVENMLTGIGESDPDYGKKLQEQLEQIVIHTTGVEKPFTVWDGGYKDEKGEYILLQPLTDGGVDRQTVTSYAECKGTGTGIGQSVQVVRESQFPGWEYYASSGEPGDNEYKFANVQIEPINSPDGSMYIGFAGKTADELAYYMELKNNGADTPWEVYYRSEMIAVDPELKVPVAVSVAEQTPIPSTKEEKISVKLSNFPKDFLEKAKIGTQDQYRYQDVEVRTYPGFMANNIVLQGWKVSEAEYTAEELKVLKVTESGKLDGGNKSSLITGTSVKKGYVIVWAGENKQGDSIYTVYYNALLKETVEGNGSLPDGDFKSQYRDNTYMKNQIFYYEIDLSTAINNIQPKPVAFLNAAYNGTTGTWANGARYDEADQFILTWDQAKTGDKPAYPGAETDAFGKDEAYKNAVYRLTLTGAAADGKVTVLENEREITTVDRTATGYNTYTADSGSWDYTNIHVKLTRVGEVNEKGITTKFPSVVELDFPMRRRLSQVKDVTISLKRNAQGVVIKDALQYDISFNGITEETEKNALSVYRITVKSLSNEANVKTFDIKPEDIRVDSSNRLTADLDLTGFREERISITVQAVANEDSTAYRNGLASPAREMTVPRRLYPPQMGKPEGRDENNMTAVDYVDDRVMTVREFTEAALILNMKEDDYGTQTAQIKYQIALGLYDSLENATEGKNPVEAADAGLPEKSDENKVFMTYSSATGEHRYVIENLPITYAGKWVRVVLRSLGSSSISSVWTDEAVSEDTGIDGGAPVVEACMVFKLPAVQVDAVKFKELDDTEAWEKGIYTVYQDGKPVKNDTTGLPMEIDAAQRWVWFDTVDYADDYQIRMVQTLQQADEKATAGSGILDWQVSDVNWITLTKKAEDAYELIYRSSENADARKPDPSILKIKTGEEKEIPYLENIRILDDKAYYIQSQARLRLEPGEDGKSVSVGILLPDCRVEDVSAGTVSYERTEQILVQSVARMQETNGTNDSGMGAYRDSKWALVNWSGGDMTQSTDPINQDREVSGPTTPPENPATETTAISDVIYTSKLEGPTRYLVRITDGAGTELGLFGVPVFKSTTIGSFVQSVWFPKGFKDYAETTVNLEFQSIFDVTSVEEGGLSEGYTAAYPVALPALTAVTDETSVTSKMAEPAQYRINVAKDTGLWRKRKEKASDICLLTAAQKTLTWDYDLSDTTVAGYELGIGGSQMEKEFKENIDLHRGLFGVMPGLQEYLEPGGKLLYTVDYHVDGDLVLDLTQEYPLASGSDAAVSGSDPGASSSGKATASDTEKATASNTTKATASNLPGEPNVLALECRLRAEYIESEDGADVLRFTLMLPDLSFDWMQEEAVELYQDAFEEGLYQTEAFRLMPVMSDRCYKKAETLLDLMEMRGELQE